MKAMSASRLVRVATMGAIIGLGCSHNHNDGNATPVDNSAAPLEMTLLAQGEFQLPPSERRGVGLVKATKAVPFTSTTAGTLQAQVNWTFATNTVAVAYYPQGCTSALFDVGACAPVSQGSSHGKTTESRVSLYSAPGTYVLGIRNLGPDDEVGAFQVVLNH